MRHFLNVIDVLNGNVFNGEIRVAIETAARKGDEQFVKELLEGAINNCTTNGDKLFFDWLYSSLPSQRRTMNVVNFNQNING
jgi:hypothetical protein